VSGQPFKILAILLEQSGEVVTREELQKNLWPDDTFVDFEHSLNSAIKKLRTVLGDSAENPRYIETLPRLGYRFIAPVERSDLPATADRPPTPAPAAPSATEELRAAQQIESVSAFDGSPTLLAPFVAPVGEEAVPGRASVDQETDHAKKLAVRPGLWIRRALGFGALLTVIAVVAFVIVTYRRNRELPFETLTTMRLTSTGHSLKAAISPDGRYIVHTLSTSGRESLRVRRTTTLHDIEIVPPEPVHYLGLTFSPDSENVYYVTHTAESDPSVLYRVPVMGGSSQKLKQDLASSITFSPDGKKFAFVRESATESTLLITDLDSGREKRLASRRLAEVLDYPAWSPDGRIVACTAVDTSIATPRGSDARIIEVRVGDGSERTLSSQTWGFIKQLAWLGDGRGLVMSARGQESGIFHVWYVSYPGGAARKLTDGLNQQVGASISADSRHIVTVEESALSGMWRVNSPQARDPEPVVSGLNSTSSLVWMPDGRILFDKELNGSQKLSCGCRAPYT
jgi:DNA-binding winged helix-turn-helix (wHTH) protein/Tol biopolymer transport system component